MPWRVSINKEAVIRLFFREIQTKKIHHIWVLSRVHYYQNPLQDKIIASIAYAKEQRNKGTKIFLLMPQQLIN